ncbi:PPC domain-containing DNA-binding protein [Flaviaesturariibacter terrae]
MKPYLLIGLLTLLSCQAPMTKTHVFRLKPGTDLRRELQSFATRNAIDAGWIVTCVGSLTDYNIRFANQPEGSKGSGHFEIVSLTGTLARSGVHIHISLSDSSGHTIGGHLLEGNRIYTTAEIVVQEDPSLVFTREKDGTTPWEELQVKKKDGH